MFIVRALSCCSDHSLFHETVFHIFIRHYGATDLLPLQCFCTTFSPKMFAGLILEVFAKMKFEFAIMSFAFLADLYVFLLMQLAVYMSRFFNDGVPVYMLEKFTSFVCFFILDFFGLA